MNDHETTLATSGGPVVLRAARREEVPAIVALLADDPLSAARGDHTGVDAASYLRAFDAIEADPRNLLLVAVSAGDVVGTLQLTFIPGLGRGGGWRTQVEGVRVRADLRGRGLGGELIRWAVAEAGRRGCALVQLTSDDSRTDAHRFYTRLGFRASHTGFKLPLPPAGS